MQLLFSHPAPADDQAEDDIDRVFKQLLPVELSSERIARMLAHIRHTVRPLFPASEPSDSERSSFLVIRNERCAPS